MANNRLYIADPNSKKAVMIAKSMGRGWETWYKNYPGEIAAKLDDIFDHSNEIGDVGNDTDLVIITEYNSNFDQYDVIEIDGI